MQILKGKKKKKKKAAKAEFDVELKLQQPIVCTQLAIF
jgi:hypothetical protein